MHVIVYRQVISYYEYRQKHCRKNIEGFSKQRLAYDIYPYVKDHRHIEIVEGWYQGYQYEAEAVSLWCFEVRALIEGDEIKEETI